MKLRKHLYRIKDRAQGIIGVNKEGGIIGIKLGILAERGQLVIKALAIQL